MAAITIPDEIVVLVTDIWKHFGFDDQQRKCELDRFQETLSSCVLKFLEQEQNRVEEAKSSIDRARERIVMISRALGEPDIPDVDNTASLLEQLRRVATQESSFQQRKAAVVESMEQKFTELKSIYLQLSMEVPEEFTEVGDADLTQSRLSYIDAALDQARQERNSRQAKLAKLVATANEFAQKLEQTCVNICGITPEDLFAAEAKLNALQNSMSEQSQKLEQIQALVQKRWVGLQKTHEYIALFKNCLSGYVATDIRLFERELERLNMEHAILLPKLIDGCRQRIRALRGELRQDVAVGEMNESNTSSDCVLHDLEQEESALETELEVMGPLLHQIAKWEKLRSEFAESLDEMSAYANDPNRFHGRQAFKMLKKEEDLRRLESKTLPRMQEKLLAAVQTWEQEQNRTLTIDGKVFSTTLKELSCGGKENSLQRPSASPAAVKTPNTANQTSGLMRRPSVNSASKKPVATPDVALRPRRLRISGIADTQSRSPTMQDRLVQVLEQADSVLKMSKNVCSQEILSSISRAIEELEVADPWTRTKHADALSDLYHKRAVIYTHLGDYDASIRDSEAAQAALSCGREVVNTN